MTNSAFTYAAAVNEVLNRILDTQLEPIGKAAQLVADAVAGDGLLYTFGTGHSHVTAEDLTYRAGGLIPVDAIMERSLSGHEKVAQSEYMERVEGIARVIWDYYEITPRDALIVISNSGRNAAPIEMAMIAKEKGVPVIGVTSLAHSQGTTSRHSSGKKMYAFCDVVIDNLCPKGDCLLRLEGLEQPVGAGSSVATLFILNMIITQAAQNLLDRGIVPPVGMSGNLDGSYEYNKHLIDRYKGRIKVW
ncbi:MAG TPA: SIS domain-containing protein [Anaerolineaceae bacterium]